MAKAQPRGLRLLDEDMSFTLAGERLVFHIALES
jgi:hypothetical protein